MKVITSPHCAGFMTLMERYGLTERFLVMIFSEFIDSYFATA
jgi:hypothetical protein